MGKWHCSVQSYQPTQADRELDIKFHAWCELIGMPINAVYDKKLLNRGLNDTFRNDIKKAYELIMSDKPIPPDLEQRIIANRPSKPENTKSLEFTKEEISEFFS